MVALSVPYTIKPAITAHNTPMALPISCALKLTPPRPPSALLPKIPAAIPPHKPHKPCKGQTPSTSSIFHLFCVSVNITTNTPPAIPPTTNAPSGCIKSEPAHTATRPASGPLCRKPGSFLPKTSAASVPPTMAINELTATSPEILSRVWALITLKPNQPTVRIHAPNARKGILDGGCAAMTSRPLPSLRYRLLRAPSKITAANASHPPTACTTIEPAKS